MSNQLKDFISYSKNKNNKQVVLTLKKRKMKILGISESDLLNMRVKG